MSREDTCPRCGGDMEGDGYTSVQRCENADPDPWLEPDANPVFCDFEEDGA